MQLIIVIGANQEAQLITNAPHAIVEEDYVSMMDHVFLRQLCVQMMIFGAKSFSIFAKILTSFSRANCLKQLCLIDNACIAEKFFRHRKVKVNGRR